MFVTRSAFQQVERRAEFAERRAEHAEQRADRAEAQSMELLERILDMKREGYHPPPEAPPGAPVLTLPETVSDAIAHRSAPGTDLRHDLIAWASAALAQQVPHEEIRRRILRGSGEDLE